MIKLVQFYPALGVRNLSPFCLKLETYLRLAGIEHEVVRSNDARRAPKGKLPYLIDGDLTIGDSALIIDYLKTRYGDPLDAGLSRAQQAQSVAWRALCEDHLLFALLYSRWIDPAGWQTMQTLFAPIPQPLRLLISRRVRARVRQQILEQGMGRHSAQEIYRFGLQDLAALETLLGDQDFMFGAQPTSLDAIAYGFLANLVDTDFDNPLNHRARATPSFVAYCARLKQRAFCDPS